MRNIKLLLEYDGTRYAGWQIQSSKPTVQGTLIHAIKVLTGESVKLVGASRTDSGVHAMGQVANFTTTSSIPLYGIKRGLNSILPGDIAVKEAEEVPPEFHARRSAKSKTYLYRIFNRDYIPPLARNRCWSVFHPLNLELMRQGAEFFLGKKDFTSFMASGCDARTTVREIMEFRVDEAEEGFIEITVRGTAFLRHMVRIMVGTLVTCGLGKITPEDIGRIIEARDRTLANVTAPPQGLFLKEVEY